MSWTTSGPKSPCPCCGRTATDKCRWDETTISCWWGERWSPPSGLGPGDVLTLADGARWYVSRLDGGFGGNSLILHPHREQERPLHPAARRRVLHQQQQLTRQAQRALEELRATARACLAAPDFEFASPTELCTAAVACGAVPGQVQAIRQLLAEIRRLGGEPPIPPAVLKDLERDCSYQAADLARWQASQLGPPSFDDIREVLGTDTTTTDQPQQEAA